MSYDPEFPYRINGDPVNADSVGVALPIPGDDTALEVTCTREGVVLDVDGESVLVDAKELRHRYFREVNERRAREDEQARILADVEAELDRIAEKPREDRRAMMLADCHHRVRGIDTPHAGRVKERIMYMLFPEPEE